jgi:hypothetical protein
MTDIETRINLPVPEPKDLPRFWKFRGWMPTVNQLGWFAFLTYENPTFPPMGQQLFFSHTEMSRLKESQRVKIIQAEMVRIIEETHMSLKALGWFDEIGLTAEDIKKATKDV